MSGACTAGGAADSCAHQWSISARSTTSMPTTHSPVLVTCSRGRAGQAGGSVGVNKANLNRVKAACMQLWNGCRQPYGLHSIPPQEVPSRRTVPHSPAIPPTAPTHRCLHHAQVALARVAFAVHTQAAHKHWMEGHLLCEHVGGSVHASQRASLQTGAAKPAPPTEQSTKERKKERRRPEAWVKEAGGARWPRARPPPLP